MGALPTLAHACPCGFTVALGHERGQVPGGLRSRCSPQWSRGLSCTRPWPHDRMLSVLCGSRNALDRWFQSFFATGIERDRNPGHPDLRDGHARGRQPYQPCHGPPQSGLPASGLQPPATPALKIRWLSHRPEPGPLPTETRGPVAHRDCMVTMGGPVAGARSAVRGPDEGGTGSARSGPRAAMAVLFVAQRFDGIQVRCLPSGIGAEKDPHRRATQQPNQGPV